MTKKYNFGKVTNKFSKNVNEIICILDGSGSMSHMKSSTINGFNSFIKEQKKNINKNSKTLLTLIIFHNKNSDFGYNFSNNIFLTSNTSLVSRSEVSFDVVYNRVDINEVEPLSSNMYNCYGNTPLLDSIGKTLTITNVLSKESKKVMCLIMTDGQENCSSRYSKSQIKEMIEYRQALNWNFVFIGANMESFSDYREMGFGDFTISMSNTDSGYQSAWGCMNKLTRSCFDNNLNKDSFADTVSNYSADLSTTKIL